jgi:hypothetical protein
MTKDEALKLALEALQADELDMVDDGSGNMVFRKEQAFTAIKEALAKEKALQDLHDENERLGLYKDAYAEQETEQDCVGWFGYDTGLRLWFETNKGDDGAIPLYKRRRTHE